MIYDYGTVLWVLNNYGTLARGLWPDPRSAADLGLPNKRIIGHAPFEDPCLTAAEIGNRVARCGLDGFVVEERYGMKWGAWPQSEAEIAHRRHILTAQVYSRISNVILYCTDQEQAQKLPYQVWKWQPKVKA